MNTKELQEIKVTMSRLSESLLNELDEHIAEMEGQDEWEWEPHHIGIIQALIVGYEAAWDTLEAQEKELSEMRENANAWEKKADAQAKELERLKKQLKSSRESVYGISVEADEARFERSELKKENEQLRNQLSDLCPVGDLDVITSLKAQKSHMADEITELRNQLQTAVNALEWYADRKHWWSMDEGKHAREALSHIQGKET